ncbi:MAG: hypothetical protein K8S25_13135 [Alphaproteobacteria bacterium]|nr:hypothetical protein [Alphaproteobacteria bacterium]
MFAKRVFQTAGIYGLVVLVLGYATFLFGSGEYLVATNHPEYVHGFFVATFAWQIAFLLIATDPVRYRVLMLAAMLEKFPYTLATLLLYANGEIQPLILAFGLVDGVLGVLFGIAYAATESETSADS